MISLSNRLKVLAALFLLAICPASWSSSEEKPVERDYSQVRAAPLPPTRRRRTCVARAKVASPVTPSRTPRQCT